MPFAGIVRAGIATAKSLLGGADNLMDNVTIRYWIQDLDPQGTPDLSAPVPFEAVVVRKQQVVKKADGQEAVSHTYLAFLEALPPRGTGNGRREPLDERDVITLSDGTTGSILTPEGLMDREILAPFLHEVYLG